MDFDDVATVPLTEAEGFRVSGLDVFRHALAFVAGPRASERIEIESPSVRIGTAANNDIVIEDDTISRHHCEIRVRNDRIVIRDLGSTNGTRVNDVEITEAFLAPGQEIRIGETTFRYDFDRRFMPVAASSHERFGELWGGSPRMRTLFGLLERVARSDLTCLILGETGTGKELAARSLHAASHRADRPMVVVDCGAMNPNLIESELFGHERGAFTGADRARAGCFELANGGTVFLDEIGDLPLDLQPKLLRVLERHEVKRLGSESRIQLDVRVIAATHRGLHEMVSDGTFREDLFYRLSEVTVPLPALRERLADLPLLVTRILDAEDRPTRVTEDALKFLASASWPGNVRQLRNVIRRAAAFAHDDVIDAALLMSLPSGAPSSEVRIETQDGQMPVALQSELALKQARAGWLERLEKGYLQEVMARFGDDLATAADHVGMHKKSYARLLRRYGLAE